MDNIKKEELQKQIFEWAYGVIDYLYNEGVVSYNWKSIKRMALGRIPIDYRDIIKVILSEYSTATSCDAGQALRNYMKLTKNGEEGYKWVEDTIKGAMKKYSQEMGGDADLFEGKKIIKINEETISKMVRNALKKTINESCWYGKTEPFETILRCAEEIMEKFEYTQSEDYDGTGDCDGPDITPEIYKWAEDVAYNAEKWLRYNSSRTSINGGEDW